MRKTLFSDLIQENKTSPILFESCEDMAHFLSFEERIPHPLQTIQKQSKKKETKGPTFVDIASQLHRAENKRGNCS